MSLNRKFDPTASSLKRAVLYVVLPFTLFVFAYTGGIEKVAKGITILLKYSAQAELKKMEASGFINTRGNAEYVVSLENSDDQTVDWRQFLLDQDGVVDARPTDFSNWYVVEIAELPEPALPKLRSLSQVGFVFANRGVWFCH